MVISDWITGLSMRAYVQRRFARAEAGTAALERRVSAVRQVVGRYLKAGKVSFTPGPGLPHLALSIGGAMDARFFSHAAPRLEKLLRHTQSTLTLRIEELRAHEAVHVQRLLAKLARHGDRVSIVLSDKLRAMLPVDSSIFHLVLG